MVDVKDISILVVEDEDDIRELLAYNLHREGFQVETASTGEEALKRVADDPLPHLVLLDLMLPGIGGLDVCRLLRRQTATAKLPIIMLTARSGDRDIVTGLDIGADDYITKPYNFSILLSRIKAVLRRRNIEVPEAKVLEFEGLLLDPERHEVRVEGIPISLTFSEFSILSLLAGRPGKVFTRYQIVDAVRGDDAFIGDRTVDVHIASLRKKLGSMGEWIQTVRGVGYRFQETS
ncbi:MAG TPA: response regulator transcription factor [Thermoanaerobaculia bacterium]|nr:response regulator transcription factor [Thermoanaerobaculia bacterium]HUM29649.1 response regulator transcription factor [Thermoanaerobaculia bacterium]HXK67300.1 response regulator transcription factor [Thermoanaerobaculia bacterium]